MSNDSSRLPYRWRPIRRGERMRGNPGTRQEGNDHACRQRSGPGLPPADDPQGISRQGIAAPTEKLLVHPMEWFAKSHRPAARHIVTQINIERHFAVLANGEAVEFRKACMAASSARRPQVAGANLGNVFLSPLTARSAALREVAELEHEIVVVARIVAAETASRWSSDRRRTYLLMHRGSHVWGAGSITRPRRGSLILRAAPRKDADG